MFSPKHAVVHLAGGVKTCHEAHLRHVVCHASPSSQQGLPNRCHWAPYSEPAADKPSETKAFPQPSSAPLFSRAHGAVISVELSAVVATGVSGNFQEAVR